MTVSAANDVYYDPYDVDLNLDPYPMFRRMREATPLYYNVRRGTVALVGCARVGIDARHRQLT